MVITKIKNAFKVKVNIKDSNRNEVKLSLAEETVYAIISCNSDKDGVSHIRREVIAEKAGIKEVDTITKHTSNLEKAGLLTREYEHKQGKKLVIYKLKEMEKNFMFVLNDLFGSGLTDNEIGFAIKLARLRWNNTAWIGLSNNEIIKRMKIGKGTFYKMIGRLIDLGIVYKVDDGYVVSVNYFPIIKTLSEQGEKDFKDLMKLPSEHKGKKVFLHYYKNGFADLKMSPDKFVRLCLAGLPKGEKKELEDVIFGWN